MSLLTTLLLLAFGALAVRFTILSAMVSKRGTRTFMICLLIALITFDVVELIARWMHSS